MTCQSHLSFTKKNNNYRWHFVPGLVLLIALFYMTSLYIGAIEGKNIDGIYMDESWAKNDGIVPYASAIYPSTDADRAKSYEETIKAGEKLETGIWYYMEPMEGFDHFDFCGTIDYVTTFEDFYLTLIETINKA